MKICAVVILVCAVLLAPAQAGTIHPGAKKAVDAMPAVVTVETHSRPVL